MSGRTFVIGDIHGSLSDLKTLWSRFPKLEESDTVVFLGDYIDRGPDSRGVLEFLLALPEKTRAKLVFLRGNHEDGWLRVLERGFPEFLLPAQNGTWACLRSYRGRPLEGETPNDEDMQLLLSGSFLPADAVQWMKDLLWYYEDDHGIYVHAGLPQKDGKFQHPSEVEDAVVLLWLRSREFFETYHGKRVVCGHTATEDLPDISTYTPHDKTDLWFRGDVVAIDTKCGKEGGFLSALELPALHVYESR